MIRKIVAAVSGLWLCATAAQGAPLEAYGKLPSVERVEISPSGKLIAFIYAGPDGRVLTVRNTADKTTVITGGVGETKVRSLAWAGDDSLVLTVSSTQQPNFTEVRSSRREWFFAKTLNLKTGQMKPLMEKVRSGADDREAITAMNVIDAAPIIRLIEGQPAVFLLGSYFERSSTISRHGLFRHDLANGSAVLVERNPRGAFDWVIDAQGARVAQAQYDDATGTWTLMTRSANGWKSVQSIAAPIDTPNLLGFGRTTDTVLVQVQDADRGPVWRELSLETGTWGESRDAPSGDALYDSTTGRLVASLSLAGDSFRYDFYDPRDATVWRTVTKAFPGALVTLDSWSTDRKKVVVRVDSPEEGPAYALVDLDTMHADWLSAEYVGLSSEDISPVKPVRYRAADGLEIQGYLTLPRGKEARGLPLVVLAHGGPESRDTPGFDWWAQALASRGYAVLQANFRGSAGYGENFRRAGFGEWGRKMQTDLSDGVRDLVRQGVVDPKRVCIVGASYGGYAALAGATLDRAPYRCAASYGGVSDLRSMVANSGRRSGQDAFRYWQRFMGAKDQDDPVLTTLSPASQAAAVQIPVLLIHGRDDTVVPISQSRRMAEALRQAGKPVELVELAGEDHWLSTGETRLQMLKATVEFLERNNPPN